MVLDAALNQMEEFEQLLSWRRTPPGFWLCELGPQSLHRARRARGSRTCLSGIPRPARSYGATRLPQPGPLLTGVRPRELLYFGSGALRSWDPMSVETWIEMLREKLKHISSLLRLDASVDTFLGVWTSSVYLLVG
jgi:hypothetical protein